uniref:Response regulator receiver protein n=1 Tax=Solibacter usitatus (strain Ellin6076) TaxID=234267 RepID=Q01PF9_SOLUE
MSKPLRIFLAEDNAGDVELVREALREHHIEHELTLARDGLAARDYIQRLRATPDAPLPDILLLDLNLPKAEGHELFRMFRANPRCSRTPVIVVTSSNAPKDRERAEALGAAHYFRKPSDLMEFLELGSIIRRLAIERGLLLAT